MRQPLALFLAAALIALSNGCASPGGTAPGGTTTDAADYRALVASTDRSADDRKTDERRKPAEFLAFTGVKPGMKVLDVGAGGGYSSELLARAVGPQGVVYAQNGESRPAFEERLKTPAMKNVVQVVRSFEDPVPEGVAGLDLVTLVLLYHDITYMPVDRAKMLKRIYAALKPGGVFVVIDHAARAGADIGVGKTLHRVDQGLVQREAEAAGFKLAASSDFLRNPADPREAAFFDMKIPSDKFALKFVKP